MPTTTVPGVTFPVDDVQPTPIKLPEQRLHESLRARVPGLESCNDYHGNVLKGVYNHPLLAAVHMAFSQHRPLVLSPDAVWLTIAQGVAHHMAVHGERLRSRFVAHEGKLELVFECRGWVEGSPENPWAEAFAGWAAQIREHVGSQLHNALICDFSTTGPVERAASEVVMMDVFERYFHYVMCCVCGIPSVTLRGTPGDWERLAEKIEGLERFDLGWWLEHLRPLCAEFVRASRGQSNRNHWQNICKLQKAYGGDVINGWVAKLFPYLRSFAGGPCNRQNPVFDTGEGFQSLVAPGGLSCVPFTWVDLQVPRERPMEAVAGLVGVSQHHETGALEPRIGWAVRAAAGLDVCLRRLRKEHTTFPAARAARRGDQDWEPGSGLPADLSEFYHSTNGADLFGNEGEAAVRIVPSERVQPLEWGENPKAIGSYGPGGRIWHRFATLRDGSWLALNLDANIHNAPWADENDAREIRSKVDNELFAPICHCSAATVNSFGANPVVALCFTELLERLLASGGRSFWLEPNFSGYGDAELYTRRE